MKNCKDCKEEKTFDLFYSDKNTSDKLRAECIECSHLRSMWGGIKSRCNDKNSQAYKNYGARGLKVCSEWINSFTVFRKFAIESGWKSSLSIDRIDNDKGYYPANCRFVTYEENNQNRRSTKLDKNKVRAIRKEYALGMITYKQLSEKYICSLSTIHDVLLRRTWKNIK